MAKFSLIPFDLEAAPKIDLTSELNQNDESLFLSFRIKEGVQLLDLGNGTPHKERVSGLWEKTCFELFIKNPNDQYVEFNFSPVFEWNCFYFEKKGDAVVPWSKMQRPAIDILLSEDQFLILIEIKKAFFPAGFFEGQALEAGITAVIKEKSKRKSYWALDHKDQKPNFHHFDSFKYKF